MNLFYHTFNRLFTLLLKSNFAILLFFFLQFQANAQVAPKVNESVQLEIKNLKAPQGYAPSGGVLVKSGPEAGPCITAEEFKEAQEDADANARLIRLKNPESLRRSSTQPPSFIWPTQAKAGFTDYGYYTVNFLVDHNLNNPNQLLDYNCGSRTYDYSGGDHQGTDIILWPYPWKNMDAEIMEVVAAAPGVILTRRDGFFDRMCVNAGNSQWNGLIIQHSDGSRAWYWHFKNGTVTAKQVGDSVVAGELLGKAGSSGSSSWPHVHFQVLDSTLALIDPWQGSCNSFNANSWWQNQQPYMVPTINHISTHSSIVEYYNCPTPEITYEKDTFTLNDSMVFRLYYRDLDNNALTHFDLINPSGQIPITWDFNSPWLFSATSYAYWPYVVDSWWVPGWWTLQATFGGNTYQKQFYINQPQGLVTNGGLSTLSLSPNPSSGQFFLDFISNTAENSELEIMNSVGQIVVSKELKINSGKNHIQIDEQLSSGIYVVRFKSGTGIYHEKIMMK
ncbi:hypothetical protein BH11BAC2_BH11BAC2_01820 [soil metagenome]